jgi:hypothetical protein
VDPGTFPQLRLARRCVPVALGYDLCNIFISTICEVSPVSEIGPGWDCWRGYAKRNYKLRTGDPGDVN